MGPHMFLCGITLFQSVASSIWAHTIHNVNNASLASALKSILLRASLNPRKHFFIEILVSKIEVTVFVTKVFYIKSLTKGFVSEVNFK